MKHNTQYLAQLGLHGYEHIEPVILASLITKDPLLLIGESGTGKTFLLNRISEALDLKHRHYNASQISFDDLIGFPYPESNGSGVKFLPTPSTIWEAESVLVDELNRCKPEIQNKFFSIIHERRIHGILIRDLAYRWAAMNPFSSLDSLTVAPGENSSEDYGDYYEGTEPLDTALADRFAFVVSVPDWKDLSSAQQVSVMKMSHGNLADSQEGRSLQTAFQQHIRSASQMFEVFFNEPPAQVLDYVRLLVSFLTDDGFRISPRRVQMMLKNVIAVLSLEVAQMSTSDGSQSQNPDTLRARMMDILQSSECTSLLKDTVLWSLPHRATMASLPEHMILAAHNMAFMSTLEPSLSYDNWTTEFHTEQSLPRKIKMLFDTTVDKDTRSLAVHQMLNKYADHHETLATIGIAAYPALNELQLLNEDVLGDLSAVSVPTLEIHGHLTSKNQFKSYHVGHPDWNRCEIVIKTIPLHEEDRKFRAIQIFKYLIMKQDTVSDPKMVEYQLETCYRAVKGLLEKLRSGDVVSGADAGEGPGAGAGEGPGACAVAVSGAVAVSAEGPDACTVSDAAAETELPELQHQPEQKEVSHV